MGNPYHDETGKFSSREEMETAVTRLIAKGNKAEALTLFTELKNIDRKSHSDIDSLFHDGKITPQQANANKIRDGLEILDREELKDFVNRIEEGYVPRGMKPLYSLGNDMDELGNLELYVADDDDNQFLITLEFSDQTHFNLLSVIGREE